MTELHPPLAAAREVAARALAEDIGVLGDLTGTLLPAEQRLAAVVVAREPGVLAGRLPAAEVFAQLDPTVAVTWSADDGDDLRPGQPVARVEGPARSVLAGERTALNLLCHLSGVATLTRRYVHAAAGRAQIRDTRKTTPGLRALEKAAVRAGGGVNHRGSLSDGILVKDNHLGVLSVADAVKRARLQWPGRHVQVECDSAAQAEEAVAAGADLVLLDNMTPEEVAACVGRIGGRCGVEVSGGVDLQTVGSYATAGADYISVGALTHSAPALDIGLDLHQGG